MNVQSPLNRLAGRGGVFTERGLSASRSLSAAGATLPLSDLNLRLIEVIHFFQGIVYVQYDWSIYEKNRGFQYSVPIGLSTAPL